MAAFGESCRDSGHGFSSLFDPELTPTVHRSSSINIDLGAEAKSNPICLFLGQQTQQ